VEYPYRKDMLSISCQPPHHAPDSSEEAYVAVSSEMLEKLDFSQSALCQDLLAKNICYFLDRDAFLGLGVRRSAVEPECQQ
jgi:hypothetical protein